MMLHWHKALIHYTEKCLTHDTKLFVTRHELVRWVTNGCQWFHSFPHRIVTYRALSFAATDNKILWARCVKDEPDYVVELLWCSDLLLWIMAKLFVRYGWAWVLYYRIFLRQRWPREGIYKKGRIENIHCPGNWVHRWAVNWNDKSSLK